MIVAKKVRKNCSRRLSDWPAICWYDPLALGLVLIFFGALVGGSQAQEPGPLAADPCQVGQEHFRNHDYLAAREAFRLCLETSGESPVALISLTAMGVADGRFEDAVGFGARAVAVAPQDPEAYYWYGRSLLRTGRVEEARGQWNSGLQISAQHVGILEGLARLSLAEGESARAYNILTQMQRQGVDALWLHQLLAEIAAGKGMWEQALTHLDAGLARAESTVKDLLLASQLALLADQGPRALGYCRQALRREPGPAAYGALGEAFFATEEVDSALVYLRMAVAADPTNARFQFNLANSLEISELVEEAETHFLAFLELQPNDPVGHFNYGIHLSKLGNSVDAINHVQQAIQLDPGMVSARIVLGQMLENQSRWAEALQVIQGLQGVDQENQTELSTWEARVRQAMAAAEAIGLEGGIHLLHMVLPDEQVLQAVLVELENGNDFGQIAVRFSQGPTAVKGGEIGWIHPEDMVASLRPALEVLALNETSPPLEVEGLYHLFRRIP